MKITLPKLTGYQQEVYDYLDDGHYTGRMAVVKSVRQSGKSFLCMEVLLTYSLKKTGVSIYIAPTLDQSRKIYNDLTKALSNTGLIKSSNGQTLQIVLSNGSTIGFKSTAQKESLRGFTVSNILILDECAYLPDEEIYSVLPYVNAHNAPILICSTPFTMTGYFYYMYKDGLDDDIKNVKTFDWSQNPEIERFLTPERKAFYKSVMSKAKYTTEVMGEFLTDGGLLFANIDECTGDGSTEQTEYCYVGIDFATGAGGNNDFTVISVINEKGEQVAVYRTNNLSPMEQVDWMTRLITAKSEDFKIRTILAETNSIGAVYIDALNAKLQGIAPKITEWATTNKSKQDLVTQLQIALETKKITLFPHSVQADELRRYTAEINPNTKTIKYNGKGAHDDTVIALMLSWYAYNKTFGNYTVAVMNVKKKRKRLRDKYE